MRCALLGPLQVELAGAPVEVTGSRLRALLARLALADGRPVTADTLLEALWGEDIPGGAANALQSLVSRLRRALGSAELVAAAPGGYRLAVTGTDVAEFERLAEQGRQALDAADPQRATELLEQARRLWRGPALVDIEAPFVPPAAHRLDELRLSVTEDHVAALLSRGRHDEVLAELTGLVAEHPLRERLRAQHVTALARAGRQAEALASYEQARHRLADELGVDPSAELQATQLAVLRGELTAPTASAGGTNLRAPVTSFVGRADDLSALGGLLREARLVTLTGPGGAGKTRLASEVGADQLDHCPDGVWLVELAAVTNPEDVVPAVMSTLRLRDRALLETGSSQHEAVDRLTAALASQAPLLILDNCEHLIEAAARLADLLLASCPRLRILATSREPLAIGGERLYPVQPLALPGRGDEPGAAAAVRLFAERAGAARPDFVLADWAEPVIEICRRLDGMPLAIELAAARLRSLTPTELATRLDDRFRLLTGGSRAALPRHQTLRAVVDWSWELLEKPERLLARRLAVFPGGITLQSAEAVCSDDELPAETIVELVSALVDKSLLQTTGLEGRYRMLETIRAYGYEQLRTAGELTGAQLAHARYFLSLAEAAEPQLRGAAQMSWLRRLGAEHDNLMAALGSFVDLGDADGGTRLAAALTWYWTLRGARVEGRSWLTAVDRLNGERSELAWIINQGFLAMLTSEGDPTQRSLRFMGRVLRAVRRRPDLLSAHPLVGLVHLFAAMAVPTRNHQVPAELAAARRHPDPWARACALMMSGHWMQNQGRMAESEVPFEQSMAEFQAIGDRWGMASSMESIAQVQQLRGAAEVTITNEREAIRLLTELGAYEDIAQAHCLLAVTLARAGWLAEARDSAAQAIEVAYRYADVETRLWAQSATAEVAYRAGDLAGARRQAIEVLEASDGVAFMPVQLRALFLTNVVYVDLAEHRPEQARPRALEAIAIAAQHSDASMAASAVDALACTVQHTGEAERAAVLLGIAVTTRGMADRGMPEVAATATAAETALGAAAFTAAYERGRAMSYPSALDYMGVG